MSRPDHLAPFLGFIRDELSEFCGRHQHWSAAKIGEPLLEREIGETRIVLPVELLNNFDGGFFRRTNSLPCSHLIAGNELTHGRKIRQRRRARRGGYRQRAQLISLDVRDC